MAFGHFVCLGAFVVLVLSACAEAGEVGQVAQPSLRGQVFPACSSRPDFETARQQWCGDQTEGYACSKDVLSGHPWDCNMSTPGPCGVGGTPCAWDVLPADPSNPVRPQSAPEAGALTALQFEDHSQREDQSQQAGPLPAVALDAANVSASMAPLNLATTLQGPPVRFMSWNVYYANLAARVHDIVRGIAEVNPEIASLQETVEDKAMILEALIQRTGRQWEMSKAPGCSWYFDGVIFYRSDIWESLDSGLVSYGGGGCYSGSNRGMNWAALRRRGDGAGVLVYGTHPVCCQGDLPILQAVEMVAQDMAMRQGKYGFPVALMGDLNTGYFEPSQVLLRTGFDKAFGRDWRIPLSFRDGYADANPNNPNPSTIREYPVRIDYVYFQKSPMSLGAQTGGKVWYGLPGGSDHRAVSADIVIR